MNCLAPLATIVIGSGCVFIAFALASRFYARKNTQRLWVAFIVAFVLMAGIYFRAFSQACARETVCGTQWDLNCRLINALTP